MNNTPRNKTYTYLAYAGVGVFILAAVAIRIRLLGVPFERDEGEYAYAGQLLLSGILPYVGFYNMKLPGIYLIYALLLKLFGQTTSGVHCGLLLVNMATTLGLILIGKRLFNLFAGLAAGSSFAILSLSQYVQGVFANTEHFVVFFAVVGLYFLIRALTEDSLPFWFSAGLMFGCGFITKQHGAAFILFGLFTALTTGAGRLWQTGRKRLFTRTAAFLFAGIMPYLAICLWMYANGAFEKFWFWTVQYASAYTAELSPAEAWSEFSSTASAIGLHLLPLWLLSGTGLVFIFFPKNSGHRRLLLSFLFFSILAVLPGFYFRPHYFIYTLPAASLFIGLAAAGLQKPPAVKTAGKSPDILAAFALFICLGTTLFMHRDFFFFLTPAQASESIYWPNPFNESIPISEYIAQNTTPKDTIAVLGSEPQLFFYSKRRSASGFIYTYPLMEKHDYALQMQRDMIAEIEKARPKYIILVRIILSWLQTEESPRLIFDWYQKYRENYTRVGLVQIFGDATTYDWGSEADAQPRSPYWLEIMKRKENPNNQQGR